MSICSKKVKSFVIVLTIVISGLTVFTVYESDVAEASTLYVGGTGGGNYTSIREAMDDATDGDTVFVYSGTYQEQLHIDKSIDLVGEDPNTTNIIPETEEHVIEVWSSNVTISSFKIGDKNFTLGVSIFGKNCTVEDNIIKSRNEASGSGIEISKGYDNPLIKNNFIDGSIALNDVEGAEFIKNDVQFDSLEERAPAFDIDDSSDTVMKSCTVTSEMCMRIDQSTLYAYNTSFKEPQESTIKTDMITAYQTEAHFVNCSFNESSMDISSDSDLYVDWYMHVKTEDGSGNPIPDCDLVLRNKTGDFEGYYQTNINGWRRWVQVNEYVQEGTDRVYNTPHNISAYSSTDAGYNDTTMNESKEVIVTMNRTLPVIDDLVVEPDPTKGSVEDVEFLSKSNYTLHSSGYNDTHGYLYPVDAEWTSDNSTVAEVDFGPSSETVMNTHVRGKCNLTVENSSIPMSNQTEIEVHSPVINLNKNTYHPTIQHGVDNADPGNTLLATNWSYHEEVVIDKKLNIMGESVENTTIGGISGGTAFTIQADFVNLTGFTINNCQMGVKINGSWNNIYNNNISTSGSAIKGLGDGQLNDIYDNFLTSRLRVNRGSGWTIWNNTAASIQMYDSDNFTIIENDVNNGIRIESSENITVDRNEIHGTLEIIKSLNTDILNNLIEDYDKCVEIESYSSHTTLINNTIQLNTSSTRGVGIEIGNSVNNEIRRCNITAYQGIRAFGDVDFTAYNTTISIDEWPDEGRFSIYLGEEGVTGRMVNSTFNQSAVMLDSSCTLYVDWFLHLQTVDSGGSAVPNANLTIKDISKNVAYQGKTNSNGWKKWIALTEYVNSAGTIIDYSPYNISAYHSSSSGYRDVDLNRSLTKNVTLNRTAPEIDDIVIEKEKGEGNVSGDKLLLGSEEELYSSAYNDTYGYLYSVKTTWSSDDDLIATVDEGPSRSTNLTTQGIGKCNITATDSSSGMSGKAEIEVFLPVKNIDKGTHHLTIQKAVDNASYGNTLMAYNWTFNENVKIDETVTLIGESSSGTIVDGGGNGDVIQINADEVSISNLKIKNSGSYSGDYGVEIRSSNCSIQDNVFRNNDRGIGSGVQSTFYNAITENVINNGMVLQDARNWNIGRNQITSRVYMGHSHHLNISDNEISGYMSLNDASDENTIKDNNISFGEIGISIRDSENNTFIGNKIQAIAHGEGPTGVWMDSREYVFNYFEDCYINSTTGMRASLYAKFKAYNTTIDIPDLAKTTNDVYLEGEAEGTLINCTFNETNIHIEDIAELNVGWFLHIKVEDDMENGLAGAQVDVKDKEGDTVLDTSTDSEGWIRWKEVIQYTRNPSSKTYLSPHNGTAQYLSYQGWNETNITENTDMVITVDTDDGTPPAISDVSVGSIADTSCTVSWTTDETSDSRVNYSKNSDLSSNQTEYDADMVTSHSVTLTNLEPNTKYYFEVFSTDISGDRAKADNSSDYYSFTTLSADDVPPAIVDLTGSNPTTGEDFTLVANASDDRGIESVVVNYSFGTSSHQNKSMVKSGDNWTYTIGEVPSDAEVLRYNVFVNDTSGNVNSTGEISLNVIDNDPPNLTDNTVGEGTTGDPFEFSVNVTDNIDTSEVHVEYWYGSNSSSSQNLTLLNTQGYVWEEQIVIRSDSTETLHHNILAKDISNNWASSDTFDVLIVDNDDPTADAGDDIIVEEGETVDFDASGSTDNVGIEIYNWDCDEISDFNLGGQTPNYTFEESGTYNITLFVEDAQGNDDTDTIVVTVNQIDDGGDDQQDDDTDNDGTPDKTDDDDDGDGLPDEYEEENGLDPTDPDDAQADADGDGLTNKEEYEAGTDPNDPDTDGDGVPDGEDDDPLKAEEESGFPWWILLVIAAIVIVVLAIFFKKKKEEEEPPEKMEENEVNLDEEELDEDVNDLEDF